MIFAVCDPSPLTVCINCSFLHLLFLMASEHSFPLLSKGSSMQDSAVSRDECKVIVNKKHAVQLLWSNIGSLAIRNKSSRAEHTLHRNRSSAHSKIHLRNLTQQGKWMLMAFPESKRIVLKFGRNPQRQLMFDFSWRCVWCRCLQLSEKFHSQFLTLGSWGVDRVVDNVAVTSVCSAPWRSDKRQ